MISILVLLLTLGIGIFGIILTIDFLDYLRKYEPKKWEEITYERPFGISRNDFLTHPIKPHRFIAFIFSSEEWSDDNIPSYKKKIKLTIVSLFIFLVITLFFS